tara:strand:- start:410 stop:745 length:336 start_codon:yes stop_codon:yes gene_type:complete
MIKNKLKIIDIGHSNFNLDKAMIALETEISQIIFNQKYKAVKVITGHGSGILKKKVKQWCISQEGRFKAIIFGEEYNLFNKKASDMRLECGIKNDLDFGRNNTAVFYIWFW